MKTIARRTILAAAGVAAAVIGATIQAPAAVAAPTLPRPWAVSYVNGAAAGTWTLTQEPLGISRTYTVQGVITSAKAGDCYYLRGTTDGFVPFQLSSASCDPGAPTQVTLNLLRLTVPAAAPTIQLCRGAVSLVNNDCGPALPLGGRIV